ncbi:Dimer_Tnp_hAT domain-containing protein [Cephalotus follicularis]|uniref:Dimer_Tnp_hAT domain-containing protein n=1 Tax=Cephalotus follicularis TaxID=3775 RepID=A0A1Q3C2C5_CEPFO|nr:Dimer_Tnp_hAT domain-containing protein [Cephalotus follicularis]
METFQKVNTANGTKDKCNYCGKELCADSTKHGTRSPSNHLKSCKKYPPIMDKKQALLNIQLVGKCQDGVGSNSTLTNWELDEEVVKESPRNVRRRKMIDLYMKHIDESENSGDNQSEWDKYPVKNTEKLDEDFDVLGWRTVNSPRFPILSHLARHVLATPISTLAKLSSPQLSSITYHLLESPILKIKKSRNAFKE